jgi:hypothetical protein
VQYRVIGKISSRSSAMPLVHCSHTPKVPAWSRCRAASISVSACRAPADSTLVSSRGDSSDHAAASASAIVSSARC